MEILNMNAFSRLVAMGNPVASAILKGNGENMQLTGTVRFYPAAYGALVVAEVFGLPSEILENGTTKPAGPFYALHIHDGDDCGPGAGKDAFAHTKAHYNPTNQPHPMHAGDLPPLLGNEGYAYLSCFTGRFTSDEVIGKTVVIHSRPDDFKTQPSGDSGQKLACGSITG